MKTEGVINASKQYADELKFAYTLAFYIEKQI